MEKVIIVGVKLSDISDEIFKDELEELKNLASACEMETVEYVTQNLETFNNNTYVGSGKVEEIKTIINSYDCDGIVFNDELTPSQISILSDMFDVSLYDRTFLILEIFRRRAKTKEAQLQVELASLKYTLPRLAGLRKGLSRQRGAGGGFAHGRGAGETKLELDRRISSDRIASIKRELDNLKDLRKQQRIKRKKNDMKVVSLVGYTNSGKSTTMNTLLKYSKGIKKEVLEKDMLFATLETSTRLIDNEKGKFLLTDTVGFVNKLPHQLVEAFKSTLEEVSESDLIVHVVDSSNNNFEKQIAVTNNVLKELGTANIPIVYAFNKLDKNESYVYIPSQYVEAVRISASKDININMLIEMIIKHLYRDYHDVRLFLPYEKQKEFYDILNNAVNCNVLYKDDGIEVKCKISDYLYNKYFEYVL